jgi:sec-independent protein translocase protein TatA
MFGGLGMGELVVIFMVVLLLFGAKRLPEIGSSLGKGIREFKGSLREIEGELKVPPERRPPGLPRREVQTQGAGTSQDADDQQGPRKLGD